MVDHEICFKVSNVVEKANHRGAAHPQLIQQVGTSWAVLAPYNDLGMLSVISV